MPRAIGVHDLHVLHASILQSQAKRQDVFSVEAAVQELIPLLEDTGRAAHKAIYFDGWDGLAASAVVRAIAERPPPSLTKKFDRIIHVDCSRWKSRRALQRTIAEELKLPRAVMAAFDRQDEDDFSKVDESSRAEIEDVTREIYQTVRDLCCLVIFHNGSNDKIDFADFGFLQSNWFSPYTVLWTFRGRLRLNPEIKEKVDSSHLLIYRPLDWGFDGDTAQLILEEAAEVVNYIQHNKQGINTEIAAKCISYLLWFNMKGEGGAINYDWATHASNYWVCDGIIEEGQFDEPWEASAILHEQIQIAECSSHKSFFLAPKNVLYIPLPPEMFQHSERLRVLKLSRCNFSFYSPPFHCCHSLRFFGLENCKDQQQEEEDRQGRPAFDFFKSLWVLDISHTDWDFDLSQDIIEHMAANIRELRVIEPTYPWEAMQVPGLKRLLLLGCKCKFLDVCGNRGIQVLSNLSVASSLKTLILDGFVGLQQIDPEKLPQSSLEFFSLTVGLGKDGNNNARISHISLAGCARLTNFRLCGSFPKLEVDLAHTAIKVLDLTVVADVQSLKAIFLVGCEQLRSIVRPDNGMEQLELLCIDTRVGEPVTVRNVSLVSLEQEKYFHAFVSCDDMSSLQLLVVNICLSSSTIKDDIRKSNEETTSTAGWQIPKASCTYTDVATGNTLSSHDHNKNSAAQLEPLACHLEIGEGIIRGAESQSMQGIKAVTFVINNVQSMHVHDNSSITTVIPEHTRSLEEQKICWTALSWCHVERCPRLDTIFTTNYDIVCFDELKTFSAAHLLTARSCPRLKFVLPLSWFYTWSSLETLHIVCCGDLSQVFPVEAEFLNQIATEHQNGMLEFPMLKDLYLHHLSSLRQICEAKMFAPKLETVRLRGCWGLRRLPATDRRRQDGPRRVVVDCEKDWWDNLEWDGLDVGHDPSLYAPQHSAYYKKRHLRGTVLR
ncbi:hypothetical protein BS78_06G027700 [Paspalum vaginatum]|nr:hypothetical protein BS78_06G027700 [Paspalum vaginatum]